MERRLSIYHSIGILSYLAVENLRVEKENGRWVVIPLENFRNIEALDQSLEWGVCGAPQCSLFRHSR